ncbi:MAG: peptidylprolyl isomerase [Thermoplasmata archaeon]|nr:MAG: peptidylprolyl isomerase [Thermoplasmata archaeon]
MPVKNGDKVKVEYEGTLDDGTVFDSSKKHGEPLEFEVGTGQIIPGFENAVIGMETGEEKEFKLGPSEAYGDRNPQLVQKVPKDQVPPGVVCGMMLVVALPNGLQMPVRVSEVTEEMVTIDMNHPLAGESLNFKIKVVDISS